MIPSSTIFALLLGAVFTILVPIVLLIVLAIQKKINGLPLLLGAAAFFLSQIVLRLPLLGLLSPMGWFQTFATRLIPYLLFLSFTAGLFEETARLGGALLLKKRRTYKDVISFGLGHGLCEVILLVGVSYIGNAVFALIINSGGPLSESMLPADMLETVIVQLSALSPLDIFWGILERISAVLFHIFATVLVFQGVVSKKWYYYLLAIAAHTLFNLIGVSLNNYAGVETAEIVMLIMALAGGYYTLKARPSFSPAGSDRK